MGGLRLFFGVKCFPEPVEIVMLPQSKRLKYILESYSAIKSFRVRCVFRCCLQETRRATRPREPASTCAPNERKRSVLVDVNKASNKEFLPGPKKETLFSHAPISLPVRGLLRNLWIFLFHNVIVFPPFSTMRHGSLKFFFDDNMPPRLLNLFSFGLKNGLSRIFLYVLWFITEMSALLSILKFS